MAVINAGIALLCGAAVSAGTWSVSRKIPLNANIVRFVPDPQRPWIYAIDRENSDVLFVNLDSRKIENRLYVGKDPTDCDIDATGNVLYVANKGPGTGVAGSWRIGVIALTNQTLVTSYITADLAVNVTAGRSGRLYYNSGFDGYDGRVIDTETGADLAGFAIVKTHMVITADKTRLFGQYIYEGNLGAMGMFDVSSDQITLIDSLHYSPYPYGWDYDNYSLSGDSKRLGYGKILFNAASLKDQLGLFPEQVYGLNHDGSVAFGETGIWDCTTFQLHGDARRIAEMPFTTTLMVFDDAAQLLYAYNKGDKSLYVLEQTTRQGIPFRWLTRYALPTDDAVEAQDPDNDGLNTLQEWFLDSDPTRATLGLQLEWMSDHDLTIPDTSLARLYELEQTDTLGSHVWQRVAQLRGSGAGLVFNLTADAMQKPQAFYRAAVRIY